MKIVRLEAENFKRLQAVEIEPDGNMVVIGGKNGQGKSSVLDAIWVALKGRGANPPKPIRDGEEKATIQLDLGELIVTRTFVQKEGEKYTDNLRIERPNGDRIMKTPQDVLDALIGEVGFDPFDFVQQKPDRQAEILMEMVPLSVDLDELAEQDASDFARRRDVNRDIQQLEGQLAGIPEEVVPDQMPDRAALVDRLASASETNMAIERERSQRAEDRRSVERGLEGAAAKRHERDQLLERAERLAREAAEMEDAARVETERLDALPPLDQPVDTADLQDRIAQADQLVRVKERQDRRAEIKARIEELRAESQGFTDAMAARTVARDKALTEAQMPIEGLGFRIGDNGKPMVTYEGLPFTEDQISTAAALRVSTAIAMAANPTLRVLRIRDGSLLDDDSMAQLAELVRDNDYQLWIERVGTGGVGIVIEDGLVREDG